MGIPVYWSISSPINPPKQLKPTLKRTRPLLSSILSRSRQQHSTLLATYPSYSDVVRRRNRVTTRRPSTSSSEQPISPEEVAEAMREEARRILRERADGVERQGEGEWIARGGGGGTTTSRSSSTSGNGMEEGGMFEADDIINYGDFIADGEDVLGVRPDIWSGQVVMPGVGMEEMEDEEDEEEDEEDEEEQERVDEERIVSRFMTRHGWAWENDIDHHLRPV